MTKEEALTILEFETHETADLTTVEKKRTRLINTFVITNQNYNTLEGRNKIDQWYDAAEILYATLKTERANRVYGTSVKNKNVDPPVLPPKIKSEGNEDTEKKIVKPKIKKFSIKKFFNDQFKKVNGFFENTIKPIVKGFRNLDYIFFVWLLLLTIVFIIVIIF